MIYWQRETTSENVRISERHSAEGPSEVGSTLSRSHGLEHPKHGRQLERAGHGQQRFPYPQDSLHDKFDGAYYALDHDQGICHFGILINFGIREDVSRCAHPTMTY